MLTYRALSPVESQMNIRPDSTQDDEERLARLIGLASAICDGSGVKLTTLRQQVLSIIWQSEKPIGAYAIMSMLTQCSDRETVAPPTVYRTLDFLQQHSLIHRIHSLNAYIGRANPRSADCEAVFICQKCGLAQEVPNTVIQQTINLAVNELRFSVKKQALEIQGLCHTCRQSHGT